MAIRWQLAWPGTPMPFLSKALWAEPGLPDAAGVLQQAVHDARDGDDLPRDHPDPGRSVRQLHDPADDRGTRHGVPEAEHALVLVHAVRLRRDPQLVLVEGGRPRRAGRATRPLANSPWSTPGSLNGQTWWLVGVLFAGHLVADGVDQLHHDDPDAPGPGDEDVPDADDGLGDVHHRDPPGVRAAGPDLGPGDAAARPDGRARTSSARPTGRSPTARRSSAAASRCSGSTCSGSTRTRPSTS